MIKKVYFDTNIFDHIHKGINFTEAETIILRSAVKAGRISIVASYLNLEETLSALKSSHTIFKTELQLILSLSDWRRPIKDDKTLLTDDIRCYARKGQSSEPFALLSPELELMLRELINLNPEDKKIKMSLVIEAVQKQKENFKSSSTEIKNTWLRDGRKLDGKPPSFEQFWVRYAEDLAESLAERIGELEACKIKGIKGLLEIRSVRLCVGANLSLIYGQHFEGRSPNLGDSRDMKHIILASAAEIFVTHDKKLAKLLSRIPIDKFEIMNLGELLTLCR